MIYVASYSDISYISNIKERYVMSKSNSGSNVLGFIFATCTAIVGHSIHHSLLWSIIDFIFSPLAWLKWLVCGEVNMTIIKNAFGFFIQ